MTIPYVPGWGDNLAQSLPNLAGGLAHIINPQVDQQMALKAAITKDPSILRAYASIERDNPGTLAKMGFGKQFGDVVGSIQPSPEEAMADIERKKKTEALSTPEGSKAFEYKYAHGETESETQERQASTAASASQKKVLDLNARVTQDQLDQLDIQNKKYQAAFKLHPVLSGKDMAQAAADVYNGKPVDPTILTVIKGDRTLSPIFEDYQKGMVDRAKLAIEQGRLDAIREGNKGQQAVAANEAIRIQKMAEQRVQQLEALNTKYGGLKGDEFGIKETMAKNKAMTGDTSMLDEINAFKALKANNNKDLIDAQKDAKRYRAITLEIIKMNPEFKKAMDALDKQDALDEKNKAKTDEANNASSSVIQQAREAIATIGIDSVKKTSIWKSLSPEQQNAATLPITFSPKEPSESVRPSKNNTIKKSPNTATSITPTTKPKISQDTGLAKARKTAGPGPNSSIERRQLNPYDAFIQQLRDVVNGRPIGDYSGDMAPEYQQDNTQSPSLPPYGRMHMPQVRPSVGPRMP